MIYSLGTEPPPELVANLKCLQDCVQTDAKFQRDLKKLDRLRSKCCETAEIFASAKTTRS